MSEDTLVPTTHAISENCPKFRLLVVGASGVGKSKLQNVAFGLDLKVHDDRAGVCDIRRGIQSKRNPYFVAHDSQGYASGETKNYDTVQRFIAEMDAKEKVADKLHAIWLCIESTSTLVLQKGAEKLFLFHGEAPLIVVFMQYDVLVMRCARELMQDPRSADLSDEDFDKKAEQLAYSEYQEHCVKRVNDFASQNSILSPRCVRVSSEKGYEYTVQELIQVTYDVAKADVAVPLAMAQRSDDLTKVNASILIGRKEYWRGLAAVTGASLKQRLRVIHADIVNIWFKGNQALLDSGEVIASLIDTPDHVHKGWKALLKPLAVAGPVSGVAAVSGPAAPIAVPAVFVGMLAIGWLYEVNANAPVVLRRMMAYIIHLVNVMRGVFLTVGQSAESCAITEEELDQVVKTYRQTKIKEKIDHDVAEFTRDKVLWSAGRDMVLEELTLLIKTRVFKG